MAGRERWISGLGRLANRIQRDWLLGAVHSPSARRKKQPQNSTEGEEMGKAKAFEDVLHLVSKVG
jgi:hypothetical protein